MDLALGRRFSSCGLAGVAMLSSAVVLAQTGDEVDLTELSLEELMQVQVTSVSKREESLSGAAAAIFVLSGDDIRRSGARTFPEMLRMVPGVQVAQIDAHSWAVTARGFNGTFADKLEVRVDGRSIYTALASGVAWEYRDTFIDDIDRIEVIRGPGASLWGANAVNGVVNIITKSALDTTGTQVLTEIGEHGENYRALRYGQNSADGGAWRAFVVDKSDEATVRRDGTRAVDAWEMQTIGLRYDRESEDQQWGFQAEVTDGDGDDATALAFGNGRESYSGHYLIGRWGKTLSADSKVKLQVSSEHLERKLPEFFDEERDTYDLDIQHSWQLNDKHFIVWGGGHRRSVDKITPSPLVTFDPPRSYLDTFNLYVQDQIALNPKLTLTIGSKFEHNDYTDFEVQPTVRAAYRFSDTATVWGAASRSVRTPNRVDNGFVVTIPGLPPTLGSDEFESEEVHSYELGWRFSPEAHLSVDLTGFFNQYDKLRGVDNQAEAITIINAGDGDGWGAEASLRWFPTQWFKAWLAYSYLNLDIQRYPGTTDDSIAQLDEAHPENQVTLRLAITPLEDWQIDAQFRYMDAVPDEMYVTGINIDPVSGFPIPSLASVESYSELNLRIAWQANEHLEFSLRGENLLNERHREWGFQDGGEEIQRTVYGAVRLSF